MRNNVKPFLLTCLICIVCLFSVACNRSTVDVDSNGNPLATVEENSRAATPAELRLYTSPEFLIDPDGDGLVATNAFWLRAKASPFVSLPTPSLRASIGTGKKILFYTRLNNQWLNFTSDLRQLLADEGYTVVVHNQDTLLPDLTDVDVLAIVHSIGTPLTTPNDRPMPYSDKQKIRAFVASGKGFFFSGDWLNSEMPKFNDIAGIFNVTMSLHPIDYILTGYPPPTMIYIPTWNAYVMDRVNYYGPNPSQPIMKKAPVFNWMSFSNETHEIFKDVNNVLFLGTSHVRPRVSALAAIRTHPTTSIPRDWPIVPQGYPIVLINEYSAGRYAISCDTNAFGNDGFSTSVLAGTDNRQFAKNIFNWLAKVSPAPEDSLKIFSPASGSSFAFGELIPFVGSQTGSVSNIQWTSNLDGSFGAGSISVATSGLRIGTHTITLSGHSSGGQPLSDSITVVVQPLVIEINFNPLEVRPTGVPNAVPTTITVTVTSNGQPVQNHPVIATATPLANSGGHFHNGLRPVGTFTPALGNTNAVGIFTTSYAPSLFGGTETIIIRSNSIPNFQGSRDITVRVQNLILLEENQNSYIEVGGRNAHPGPNERIPHELDNPNTDHFGTQGLITAIQGLADAYNARFPNIPENEMLHINDMSLENGGLFDIEAHWNNVGGHNSHRTGINVDIETQGRLTAEERTWLREEVTRRPADFDDARTLTHGGNHLHLQSNN